MVTSPAVSWLFFKARAKRPYLSHTGRASNAEKQPTGPGPEGCVENGPAAALLVGYVSIQICSLNASPARTALPTAHFDRNNIPAISGTGHWSRQYCCVADDRQKKIVQMRFSPASTFRTGTHPFLHDEIFPIDPRGQSKRLASPPSSVL